MDHGSSISYFLDAATHSSIKVGDAFLAGKHLQHDAVFVFGGEMPAPQGHERWFISNSERPLSVR